MKTSSSRDDDAAEDDYEMQPVLQPSDQVLLINEQRNGMEADSGSPWFNEIASENHYLAETVACICPSISCASLQVIVFAALRVTWSDNSARALYATICLASGALGVVLLSVAHIHRQRLRRSVATTPSPSPALQGVHDLNPFALALPADRVSVTMPSEDDIQFHREADADFARRLEYISAFIVIAPILAKLVFVTQRDEFVLVVADPSNNGPRYSEDPMSTIALPVDLFVLLTAPMMLSARLTAMVAFAICGVVMMIVTLVTSQPDSGNYIAYAVNFVCLELSAILLGLLTVLRNDKENRQRFIARINLDKETKRFNARRADLDQIVITAFPSFENMTKSEAQQLELGIRYLRMSTAVDGIPLPVEFGLSIPALGSQQCTVVLIDVSLLLVATNSPDWAKNFTMMTHYFDAMAQEAGLHRLTSWHGTLMATSGFTEQTDASTALQFLLDFKHRVSSLPDIGNVDSCRGALVTGIGARGFCVSPMVLRWHTVGPAIRDALTLLRNPQCVPGYCYVDQATKRIVGAELGRIDGVQGEDEAFAFVKFPFRPIKPSAAAGGNNNNTPPPLLPPAAVPRPAAPPVESLPASAVPAPPAAAAGRGTSEDDDDVHSGGSVAMRHGNLPTRLPRAPVAPGPRPNKRLDHTFQKPPHHLDKHYYDALFAYQPAPVPEPIPRCVLIDPFFPKFANSPNMYYRGLLADLAIRHIQIHALIPFIALVGLFLVLASARAWGSVALLVVSTGCVATVVGMALVKKVMVGGSGPSILRFTVAVLATVFCAMSAVPMAMSSRPVEVNLISYVAVVLHMWSMSYVIDPVRFGLHAGVNAAVCALFVVGSQQAVAVALATWSVVLSCALCVWRKQSKEAMKSTQLMSAISNNTAQSVKRMQMVRSMLHATVCSDLSNKAVVLSLKSYVDGNLRLALPKPKPLSRFVKNTLVLRIDVVPSLVGHVMSHHAQEVESVLGNRSDSSTGSRHSREAAYATAAVALKWVDTFSDQVDETTASTIVKNSWKNHGEIALAVAEAQAFSVARAQFRRVAPDGVGDGIVKPFIDLVAFCGDSITLTGQLPWGIPPIPSSDPHFGQPPTVTLGAKPRHCRNPQERNEYLETLLCELVSAATVITKRLSMELPFGAVQCAVAAGDVTQLVTGRTLLQATVFGSGVSRADSLVRHAPAGKLIITHEAAAKASEANLSECVRAALEKSYHSTEHAPGPVSPTMHPLRAVHWESYNVPGDHICRLVRLFELATNKPTSLVAAMNRGGGGVATLE